MNWFSFLISLAIGYMLYYVLNILYDLFFYRPKDTAASKQQEIIIPLPAAATKVTLNRSEQESKPAKMGLPKDNSAHVLGTVTLESTGGVSLKELFSLMQSQVIEYTKAIPY